MLNSTTLISWTSSIIFVFFSIVLFLNSRKNSGRSYGLLALTCALWSLSQGFFYYLATSGGSYEWLLFFNRLNHFSAASIGPIFFYFSYLFPEEKEPPKALPYLLALGTLLLGYFYLFTDTVIHDVFVVRQDHLQYGWHYGKFQWIFYIHFLPAFFGGVLNLVRKLHRITDPLQNKQVMRVLWAIFFGALPGIIIAIVLTSFGNFNIARFAPSSALLWVAFTAYVIVRYHAIEVKLIAAEIALLAMLLVLFLNIFAPDISFGAKTLTALPAAGLSFNLYSAVNWIAGICFGAFTIILFTGNRRPSTRIYSLVSLSLTLWAFAMGVYYMVTDHQLLLFLNRFNHFIGGAVGVLFFYFAFLFPTEEKAPRWLVPTLFGIELFLGYFYFFTDLIIKDTFIILGKNVENGWLFGRLGFLFHLNFIPFFTAGIYLLWKKFSVWEDIVAKKQLRIILSATILGSLIGITVAVILPLFGLFRFSWLGPVFTLSWVVTTAYAIIQYKVLNLRLLAGQFAVLAMAAVLFLNIFLPEWSGGSPGGIPLIAHLQSTLIAPSFASLANWLGGILLFAFGLIIYFGSKQRSTRMLSAVSFTLAAWSFGAGLYYMATDPALLQALNKFDHWVGSLAGFFLFLFAWAYPEEKTPPRRTLNILIVIEALFAYICLGTNLVIEGTLLAPTGTTENGWLFGPLGFLFHVNLIVFYGAGILLLYKKYFASQDPEQKRKLFVIPTATMIGSTITMTTNVVLPLLGIYTFGWLGAPFSLAWVGLISYTIIRYKVFNVRLILPELAVLAMLILLFTNIFIPEKNILGVLPGNIAHTTATWAQRATGLLIPHGELSVYSAVPWLTAAVLAAFGVTIYLGNKNKTTRAYSLIVFNVMAWALGIGAYYYTSSLVALNYFIRFNHFVGGLIGVTFLYYTLLVPDERVRNKFLMPIILGIQGLLAYLYFFTPYVIKGVTLDPRDILGRDWIYGPFGFISDAAFGIFLTTAFVSLRKRLGFIVGQDKKRRLYIFWTSFAGALPGVILVLVLSQLGYRSIYWITPTATLGWIFFSFYAIVRYHFLSVKIIAAEVLLLLLSAILFGNIFVTGHITPGSIGKIAVFTTFTTVGIFFIRDIIKNEDQKEELAKLSIKLTDLGANLQAKVEERTRELTRNKAHLETVIEHLTNGLVEYDTDGTVIRINKTAEKMLGVSRDAIVGKKIVPGTQDRPEFESLARITFPKASTDAHDPYSEYEATITHPTEREIHITTSEITKNGKLTGIIKVLRDVTRENLISRSKSEFISIAAHQLRSPLSVIKWTLSAFEAGDFGPMGPELTKSISDGTRMNQRMINLVNDLLIVARIEGGKYECSFADEDIFTITEEAMLRNNPLAEQKHIVRNLEKNGTKSFTVRADREKLSVAISNVIANAYQYTPEGGTVNVTVSARPKQIDIIIRDSGIGISPSQKERIFSKFYRSEGALRMNPNGSGLGLFIIRHILKAHGGDTTVTSRSGKGTTITLSIPRT